MRNHCQLNMVAQPVLVDNGCASDIIYIKQIDRMCHAMGRNGLQRQPL